MVWEWGLDGWILLIGILAAASAALLGNFLVLRRLSLLGDAISHAILPGLALAFLWTGQRQSWVMFVGAVVAGILTAAVTHWLKSHGNVDEGASLGIVFTTLFALGLLIIVQAADRVDLDASCVLYGAIELTPLDTQRLGGWEVPRAVIRLFVVFILNLGFVGLFYKELKLMTFDPALAATALPAGTVLHYALMTLVAVTTVACFESVGNILVVAMLIVPASTALLLSERLSRVILGSLALAAASAILGHLGAIAIPAWFGFRSTTTAGMMAVASGLLFMLAALFSPRQGWVFLWWRRQCLAMRILKEDLVAALFRFEEQGESRVAVAKLSGLLLVHPWTLRFAGWWQMHRGLLQSVHGVLELTERGRDVARELVRTHRLWEAYLADQAGEELGRLHAQAERLEHFTDRELQQQLQALGHHNQHDPHGRVIPLDPAEPTVGRKLP
jgi:manganese/zinc/iron transport system permease protein